MTVNTRVIKLFLMRTDMAYVPLQDGLRLQILPNITYLPSCQKHHFAAFIHDTSLLIVWDDDPRQLLSRAKNIENQLMAMIWEPEESTVMDEKRGSGIVTDVPTDGSSEDVAPEDLVEKPRKLVLNQAILCGLVLALLVIAIGSGWRQIAQEIAIDSSMLRIAFVAVVPLQMWLALVSFFSWESMRNTANIAMYSSSCNLSLGPCHRFLDRSVKSVPTPNSSPVSGPYGYEMATYLTSQSSAQYTKRVCMPLSSQRSSLSKRPSRPTKCKAALRTSS